MKIKHSNHTEYENDAIDYEVFDEETECPDESDEVEENGLTDIYEMLNNGDCGDYDISDGEDTGKVYRIRSDETEETDETEEEITARNKKIDKEYSKMSDEEYFRLFDELTSKAKETGELDFEILAKIYLGKVQAIAIKQFQGFKKQLAVWKNEDAASECYAHLHEQFAKGAYFFKHSSEDFKPHPIGFLQWCKITIKHFYLSEVRKSVHKIGINGGSFEDWMSDEDISESDSPIDENKLRNLEVIRLTYNCVAELNCGVHKKLAFFVVMSELYHNVDKKYTAIDEFIYNFENTTLDDIFVEIISFLNAPGSHLSIHRDGVEKMLGQLDKETANGVRMGETAVSEHVGNQPIKIVVSKWISYIKKQVINCITKEGGEI